MDNYMLKAWILVLTIWAILFCIYTTLGFLARKRGRSFWGWTLVPFLISIGIEFLLMLIGIEATTALFLSFPIAYVIGLISVLLSGKTKEKRMQEIQEEEEWRKSISDKL